MATFIFPREAAQCQDTWVQEDFAGTNNAANVVLAARGTAAARRRIFIRFADIAAQIPNTWTIGSSVLTLFNAISDGTARTFSVHVPSTANAGWTTALTWNFRLPSSARWPGDAASDGGTDAGCTVATTDFVAVAEGTIAYTASTPLDTPHTVSLLASTQAIVTGGVNTGWLIVLPDAVANFTFHSNEAANAALRPTLTVQAYPPVSLGRKSMLGASFLRGVPHGVLVPKVRR